MASIRKIASAHKTQYYGRALLLAVVILMLPYSFIDNHITCSGQIVTVGNNKLCAMVADDGYERSNGLSGIKELANNQVMLFIFDSSGKQGIWMKDMLIPIDILWLNENKQVVWIEKNISPDSYPRVYYPDSPSRYVIEASAGFSNKYNLTTNYQFSW